MAKIWVTDNTGHNRTPFLRGILTLSLIDARLPFGEAYQISSTVRQRLEDANQISRDDLRQYVAEYLEEKLGPEVRDAYQARRPEIVGLQVRDQNGKLAPFSRMQHLCCLESCGLRDEQAAETTNRIIRHLNERHIREISAAELGRLTYAHLQEHYGEAIAHRYLVWAQHTRGERPLVLLIGGVTGSGKSSIATEVAHRLGIVRIQSTDTLREVMRMMIPQRLVPVLHTSSFNAGFCLPASGAGSGDPDAQLADGYLTQSELLAVPCEAVVQRAIRERVSVILEGVHLHPSLLQRIQTDDRVTVLMVMLAILEPERLRSRLAGRLLEAPERGESSHLDQFDKIWSLQSFLLSEADRMGIPIMVNEDKEKVTNMIMMTLLDVLTEDFSKTAAEIFQEQEP